MTMTLCNRSFVHIYFVCKRSKTCMLQLRVLEKLIMSRDPEQKNKGSNQQKRRFNSSAASTPFSQILPQDMGL